MKYYLLSEQDIDEFFWDIENALLGIKEKLEEKRIDQDNEEEE